MLGILRNIVSNPRKYLTPTYYVSSVADIELHLHLRGIEYVVFDKDDTLTLLKSDKVLPRFLEKLAHISSRYPCVIVSNGKNNPEEIEGIKILKTKSKKPYNFDEVQEHIRKIDPDGVSVSEEIVFVGDRLLTDVYMANCSGARSILVDKLEESTIEKHGLAVVVLRKIERLALQLLKVQKS